MTDHGWPDHHDPADEYGYPEHVEDPVEPVEHVEDHAAFHLDEPDAHPTYLDDDDHPAPEYGHHEVTVDEPADTHSPVTTAPDVDPEPVFPPQVDIGDLPEPVDGHPWIDTGSLGVVDPADLPAATTEPVDPHDLAAYAETELPPGADPWATLAESEDPATATLARWWRENP
jgi:hypothetical protein